MRIVSLAPSNTETLFFLGLGEEIVGVTEQCDYPEGARDRERIGSFAHPDVGMIASLQPDLVVTSGKIHERFLDEFKRQNIPVFVFASRSVEGILESVEELGRVCGQGKRAQSLVGSLRERIDMARARIPEGATPPRVFRLMSRDPLFTPGRGSCQYDAICLSGGKPLPLDTEDAYVKIPLEAVIDFDPEIIITCGRKRGEEPKPRCKGCTRLDPACQRVIEDMYSWNRWQGISTIKDARVHALPCRTICRPGPKVADLVEKLAMILHPGYQTTNTMEAKIK